MQSFFLLLVSFEDYCMEIQVFIYIFSALDKQVIFKLLILTWILMTKNCQHYFPLLKEKLYFLFAQLFYEYTSTIKQANCECTLLRIAGQSSVRIANKRKGIFKTWKKPLAVCNIVKILDLCGLTYRFTKQHVSQFKTNQFKEVDSCYASSV